MYSTNRCDFQKLRFLPIDCHLDGPYDALSKHDYIPKQC